MKKIFFTLALLSASVLSFGQNLNPQVQVTNDYQSTAPDIRKQDVPVSIPDSVMHFDYKFDYSVFDSPYKGAFEFSPYVIEYTPDKTEYSGHTLFARMGAGYPLYPVLDVVYSPVPAGNFSMSVVQNLDGYLGDYWQLSPNMGLYENRLPGYDLEEKFAVEGRWGLKRAVIRWQADYDGIFFKDWMQNGNYHSAGLKFSATSNERNSRSLFYDINLQGRFSSDIVSHPFSSPELYETDVRLYGSAGHILDNTYRVLVDYDFRYDRMDGSFAGRSVSEYALAPHVELKAGIFDIDAGARLDYAGGAVSVSPDLLIHTDLFKNSLRLFIGADGGQHALTYSGYKHFSHFFTPAYTEDFQNVFREKINAFGGFRGYLGSRFDYALQAGWAMVSGTPLESVSIASDAVLPLVSQVDFNMFSAQASLSCRFGGFKFDGNVIYRKTTLGGEGPVFDLPAFSSTFRAVYEYRSRLKVGASLEHNSAREAFIPELGPLTVPMWMDLGACLEYSFSPRFSVWARGGNLLNYFVRRDPFHVEMGINGTAGISVLL